jgi:hypothetical protein
MLTESTERRWRLPEDRKPLTRKQYAALFLKQDGRCACCGQRLEIKGGRDVEATGGAPATDEHLQPLSMLGTNEMWNRELWCKPCATVKTSAEAPIRAKSDRIRDSHIGAKKSKTPLPGSRNHPSKIRKRFNSIERWD